MTTSAGGGLPRQRWLRLAHFTRTWSWAFFGYYLIGLLATPLSFYGLPDPAAEAFARWWVVGVLVFLIGQMVIAASTIAHLVGRTLCSWCAGEWPLNGATTVEDDRGLRRRLLGYHFLSRLMVSFPVGVIVVAGIFFGSRWSAGSGWGIGETLFFAGLGVSVIYSLVGGICEHDHRIYRPWCPICREDGGWDDVGEDIEPTPDPAASKTA